MVYTIVFQLFANEFYFSVIKKATNFKENIRTNKLIAFIVTQFWLDNATYLFEWANFF